VRTGLLWKIPFNGALRLKIPLSWKDYNMKDNREQSLVPSLSLSYLLHNSMLQELFGEASKPRNKKQEEKRK